MKRIVTIGGGKGQSDLLESLKDAGHDLTAVVSVMDSGGSSGVLRRQRGLLPPGDLRRCIAALAEDSGLEERWNERDADGHAAGNLEIANLAEQLGNFDLALDQLHKRYKLKGRVLPVTTALANLVADYDDRITQVVGEEKIDLPKHNPQLHISELRLEPSVATTHQVRDALRAADLIVLTMGDLYTSVLPNLLVTGVNEAIAASQAKVVYICNRSTKLGETHNFSVDDFCQEIRRYLAPATLKYVVADNGTLPLPADAQAVPFTGLTDGVSIIQADLGDPAAPARVSGLKATQVINGICASL